MTIDHFVPLSKGGHDVRRNRVHACAECNNLKGDALVRSVEDARALIDRNRRRIARRREKRTTYAARRQTNRRNGPQGDGNGTE